ncbi:UNVERIFIED_CONTAM: hypothetical protein PYX00_008041 [Menopon gallinae]|uniref:EGF-like calcium-binding domain-containing protein n=1 Tax=Menopon gallinae TaxID=328185 RepID=A0AAW2HMV5_9NEOP
MSVPTVVLLLVTVGVSGLEPGKGKQDYESMEEVSPHTEVSTAEPEPEDASWIPEAVLDVAYYLRKHKFNGYDPRYLREGVLPKRNLYKSFSRPPLANQHWEVAKNCQDSFITCLMYLQAKISRTVLPRHLDSLTVIKHNGWTMEKDKDLIKATDDACQQLRIRDEETFNEFESPIKKFQWLESASYYMCWYTMREERHLALFIDDCDNHANCLDWSTGPSNLDYRAGKDRPFACAAYSFCPDPCCPEKLMTSIVDCQYVSPCGANNYVCEMSRSANVDLDSIILNYWNVSCHCEVPGTRWDSRSGMCVDVDECLENPDICEPPVRTCLNYRGGYACICNPVGYMDDGTGKCVIDYDLRGILHPRKKRVRRKEKTAVDSFFDFVYHLKAVFSPDNG